MKLRHMLTQQSVDPLKLDITRNRVYELLGEPDKVSSDGSLLAYGGLQIGIDEDKVTFIGIYFRASKLPDGIHVEGVEDLRAEQSFRAYLERESISYKLDPLLSFNDQVCIRIGSKIGVYFQDSNLDSIQIARK